MKKLLLLFAIYMCCQMFQPDSNKTYAVLNSEIEKNYDWQVLYNDSYVKINYRYAECHNSSQGLHHEYVYLQFINLSNQKIKVGYDLELWYNNKCLTCDSNSQEYKHSLELEAQETIEGTCGGKKNKTLYIFSRMLDGHSDSKLTFFKLNNVNIK